MRLRGWARRAAAGCGAALGLAAVTTLGGSAALADIPDSGGVAHACYRPDGPAQGQLVVIDAAVESCPAGYSELSLVTNAGVNATALSREVVTVLNAGAPVEVPCPAGKMAISGGVRWNGLGVASVSSMRIVSSYPTASGWFLLWQNTAAGVTVDAFAVCVNA